jgi:hypothetical protein
MDTYMYACMYSYIHTHKCTYITCTYMYVHAHTYMYVHAHIHVYACVHYVHVGMYAHTNSFQKTHICFVLCI